MNKPFLDNLARTFRGRLLRSEPLSRHTTWRVGGPADLFLVPADREDLRTALSLLSAASVPWFALGSGSNLLVRDGGFRGAAVHLGGLRGLTFGEGGKAVAGGGLPLMTLIRESVRRGLGGMEGLAGIPGTVGGGIVMNAGAGGQEMAGVVSAVLLSGVDGEETWQADRLSFSYRRSALAGDRIVTEACLRFRSADPRVLEEEVRTRLQHRRTAHAVRAPNAGSVFKNPPGTAAWKLIDAAGLRGARIGGAQVSEAHCNFIVNAGDACAADMLRLIDGIRTAVFRNSGIDLEPEVRIIGEN